MGCYFDLPASVSGHVDAVERRAAEALFADHGRLIVGQYIEFQQLFGRGRNLENDLSESGGIDGGIFDDLHRKKFSGT